MRTRRINWDNPITRGLVFAYRPGFLVDMVGGTVATTTGTVTRQGGSISTSGGSSSGLLLGTGALLGALATSTVVFVGAVQPAFNRAVYCERAPSGNNIYKLETATSGIQFTYRNDNGSLLQVSAGGSFPNDGRTRIYAIRKNGTTHSAYVALVGPDAAGSSSSNPSVSTGTIGDSSTGFTNAGLVRTLGYDAGDSSAALPGRSDLLLGWTRTLSQTEIDSLRAHPEQIFYPEPDSTELAALALHGTATTVSNTAVNPATRALAITGYAPSVLQSVSVAPATAALAITGYAPTVAQSAYVVASATGATLTLTGFAPTVSQSAAVSVAPGSGGLTLTGYAPTVTRQTTQALQPSRAALGLVGYAPMITQAPDNAPRVNIATIMRADPTNRTAPMGPATINITASFP